ncbi:hypothetical protein M9H77_29102 [Catharanthus roseus]|uniref:Uncharacterized protein n=1 Tax=Catharanthus roseus TaxID=4058 RepID=A0ACC0AHL5_CATRO|nr:hypothetical protein M9H77_29102 [Catharanthus roseus]
MATLSATSVRFGTSFNQSLKTAQVIKRNTGPNLVSFGWERTGFQSLRTSHFQISCAAKPETVDKVCQIVRKQLALPEDAVLTPETKFAELGADSLDTVEIVMGLEEEFEITVEEENSENITTVQEAADLIDKLVEKKAA